MTRFCSTLLLTNKDDFSLSLIIITKLEKNQIFDHKKVIILINISCSLLVTLYLAFFHCKFKTIYFINV